MDNNNIADRIIRVISEQSGYNIGAVKPESILETDLSMDSLDLIETVMAIEEEFLIEISDEEADRCKTVADVIALVSQKVGA